MRVMVTGNLGYVGTVLVGMLAERSHHTVGLDTGYFRTCELCESAVPDSQVVKDIREIAPADLEGIEGVIHLAGLSNDPLGELAPDLTEQINFEAAVRLARHAKDAGVARFVYASSQSMYGISDADEELDEDNSEKDPITSYARTKWLVEEELKSLDSASFTTVCMRPSTVFGASPRLRCDIVFNNLVACAYTTGKIEIKSDGTPWRPVVHVQDVSRAFIAGLDAPAGLVAGQSYNVGIRSGNYTVRDLAEAAQRAVPGSELTFTGEHGSDARTYRVSFDKILGTLGDYYRPQWDLDKGGVELTDFFRRTGFTELQFRGRACNRLQQVQHLLDTGELSEGLRWRG
jgi:nucleoside-diphosphate-sugar epimerase